MTIAVRLFASLARYLPPGTVGDGARLEVPDGATIADLGRCLAIPDDVPRLILVNGEDAPADRRLAPGDVVTMFPPLAGGSPLAPAVAAKCLPGGPERG